MINKSIGDNMSENSSKKPRRKYLKRYATPALILLCLLAISLSIIFFMKYKKAQNTDLAQQKKLVAQLSEVIELPQNVTPTIVTVADKDKLTNKALASRVENKDMLIIYAPTKRIIIYRPSTDKIIDMLSFETQAELPEQKTKP